MGRRLSIGPQYQPVQRSSLQLTRIVNAALGKVGDGADKPSAQKQIGVRLLPAKLIPAYPECCADCCECARLKRLRTCS
jgi:hypothetical protein